MRRSLGSGRDRRRRPERPQNLQRKDTKFQPLLFTAVIGVLVALFIALVSAASRAGTLAQNISCRSTRPTNRVGGVLRQADCCLSQSSGAPTLRMTRPNQDRHQHEADDGGKDQRLEFRIGALVSF